MHFLDREREWVLGGFASAFFLYGIALVYGGTGSTNITQMVVALQTTIDPFGDDTLVLAGLAGERSIESLKLAAGCLGDEALRAEAALAVVKIACNTFPFTLLNFEKLGRKPTKLHF